MGLLRMAARTAVVAGTATAVSGRVARRQAGRYDSSRPPRRRRLKLRQHPSRRHRMRLPRRPRIRRSHRFKTWRSCTARGCSRMRSSQRPRPRS